MDKSINYVGPGLIRFLGRLHRVIITNPREGQQNQDSKILQRSWANASLLAEGKGGGGGGSGATIKELDHLRQVT